MKSLRIENPQYQFLFGTADIYSAIQQHLFSVDSNGLPDLTQCCEVAGLGGNPYRDGSFEYYMSEPIRSNDPKAVGPFIMACIMLGL